MTNNQFINNQTGSDSYGEFDSLVIEYWNLFGDCLPCRQAGILVIDDFII